MREDRKQKYMRLFRDEVREHISAMTDALLTLEKGFDREALDELLRRLHTVKGSAHMIQLGVAGDIAHRLEDRFKPLRDGVEAPSPELVDQAFAGFDLITGPATALGAEEHEDVRRYFAMLDGETLPAEGLSGEGPSGEGPSGEGPSGEGPSGEGPSGEDTSAEASPTEAAAQADEDGQADEGDQPPTTAAPAETTTSVAGPSPAADDRRRDLRAQPMAFGTVRVDIEKLDKLLDLVGELLIFGTRLSHRGDELSALARSIADSGTKATGQAVELAGAYAEDLTELGYLIADIRYQTMEVRMLPVASILDDFYRTVRSLSRELRKQVRLEVQGKDVEVDKRLLEMTRPVLIHVLRNAIDHGIEDAQSRLASGKPEEGCIKVSVTSDGRLVTFTIEDDGKGIDADQVRRRAIENGLVSAEAAADLSKNEVFEFIFESGFSTAAAVTEISGRGVGMDVVKRGIEEMKGTLSIDSEPGQFTRLTFTLPMTLSVISVLMVEAAGQLYALPLSAVVETVRYQAEDVVMRGETEAIILRGEVVPMSYLPDIIGLPSSGPCDEARRPAVVVRRRAERMAIAVDRVIGDQDIVVKSLGDHLRSVRFVLGATFVSSGLPALILNVVELFDTTTDHRTGRRLARERQTRRARILVTDDSFTTRTMERNILESEGYLVEEATSGEDALSKLSESGPFDLFLCDIEMPGMNGVELAKRLRADERCGQKPIVIVSSCKDRTKWEQAEEAGADACIDKRCFEQATLVQTVARLLHAKQA